MTTYLDLCNKVLRQTNDVQLTQATFASASGLHAAVKDAVNFAIRDINQSEIEWPFNFTSTQQVLTPEQNIYTLANDVQWVDWESFHLERDDTLNVDPIHLNSMTFDEWNIYRRAYDEVNNTGIRIPEAVFQRPNMEWGVTPYPDRAYTISFVYYGFPSEISAYDDVPNIPSRFDRVVVDGALYYSYMFRDNLEQAQAVKGLFDRGIKEMRTILINKYQRVIDTRTNGNTSRFQRLLGSSY